MSEPPLSTKAGMDVADFKAGMAEIKRSFAVLNSEFKASAAAIGDWSKDATGLETRIDFLNKSIELQRQRVEKLNEMYQKQVAATGENSKEAQDWAIKLNNATAELNKMERELGEDKKALDEMKNGSNDVANATKKLGNESKTLKAVLGGLMSTVKASVALFAIMVTAVATLGGGLGALVFRSAQSQAALNDLALQSGITTERLQELAYAGDQIGTSQETIVSSLTKLTRSMSEAVKQTDDFGAKQKEASIKVTEAQIAYRKAVAENGKSSDQARDALEKVKEAQENLAALTTGDLAAAFDRLGISVTDSSGKLRDNEAVFAEALDALGKIKNETERDALAMQLFGKSAQELNPLIKAGSAELAKMSAEARAMGAVVEKETTQKFAAFQDTLDGLGAGLKGTLTTLAGFFLPGFQNIFDQLTGYQKQFAGIVQGSNGDIGKIAQGLSELVKTIAKDIASQAPELLESGLEIVRTIGGAILSAIPELMPVAVDLILQLVQFIVDGLPGLIEAAIQLVITLADGITRALPALIPAIVQAITTIVQTLLKNLPLLIKAATGLIIALAKGLVASIPILTKEIPAIVQSLSDVIIELAPILIVAAAELVSVLALGIIENWPTMLAAAGQVLGTLLSFMITNITTNVPAVGKALVEWFEKGFNERWNAFVKSFSDNLVALWKLLSGLFGAGSGDEAKKAGEGYANNLVEGFRQQVGRLNGELNGALATSASTLRGTAPVGRQQAAPRGVESTNTTSSNAPSSFTVNIYADGALSERRYKELSENLSRVISAQLLGEINDALEPAT